MYVTNFNIEDVYTSEKDKSSFEYLQKAIDQSIAKLVYEREHIRKCRNLYEGIRDAEEFRYLQETFGIETPLALKMTPLVKTRIDVLLGILLDEVFSYRITINDATTLDEIYQEKTLEKVNRIKSKYQEQFKINAKNAKDGKEPVGNLVSEKYLRSIDDLINESFISSFEIAAQSLLTFFSQDATIDLQQKIKQYFLDLLITGEAYYYTNVTQIGVDPILEIVKPENMFFNKNTNHQFISVGNRPNVDTVVRREYIKREEILNRWGHLLSKEDKENIFGAAPSQSGGTNIVRSTREIEYTNRNVQSTLGQSSQYTRTGTDFIPVYFVEWLSNNQVDLDDEGVDDMQMVKDIKSKSDYTELYGKDAGSGKPKDKAYRLDKYEGIRIGDSIYVNCGKSRFPIRSIGAPWQTKLSYNGVGYNERNGRSYSTAWALKDLQDSFDIIQFFRDNLIANSGVDGSRINLAAIPKVLGNDFMERLLKFMALRKQGVELIDPTEDGASLFQHYGEFRASLDGNVIQSLNLVLESIQAQADTVSGINRYMYQAAEVRDAVSNVKVGQQTTSLITKDLFELVHTSRRYVLMDLLDRARIAYLKGKRGSYIVGHRTVLFDLIADNFCFTDFNIHVVSSSKETLKINKIEAYIPELIKMGSIDPDILVKMSVSESTTDLIRLVSKNIREKKEEANQIGQLTEQLEQLTGQAKELEKSLKDSQAKLQAKVDEEVKLRSRELDIKEKAVNVKLEVSKDETERKTSKDKAEEEKDREIVQLEREQLYSENVRGNAREIKNNI